jgi:hypothetical protein
MTALNQNAYTYNSHKQSDYDAFEHAVRVFVEPEAMINEKSVLARCCTCKSAVDGFEYATRNTRAESPGTFVRAVVAERIVPEMLVLSQIGSIIHRVIKGRLTDLSVRFDCQVEVGEDLKVEVQIRESTFASSLTTVYFVAKVGRKIVAEGLATAEAAESKEAQPVNPLFAAGLFSALVNTKLPGPGASFRSLDLNFDSEFQPSIPLRTIGSLECIERGTGILCIDLFCMSTLGIVAHATAKVQQSNGAAP